jgi:hypothetical protein
MTMSLISRIESALSAIPPSRGTTDLRVLLQDVRAELSAMSVARLREQGYAVIVFSPDELRLASPDDVCSSVIGNSWDLIDALAAYPSEMTCGGCNTLFQVQADMVVIEDQMVTIACPNCGRTHRHHKGDFG